MITTTGVHFEPDDDTSARVVLLDSGGRMAVRVGQNLTLFGPRATLAAALQAAMTALYQPPTLLVADPTPNGGPDAAA